MKNNKKGFTIVELVIVIAVIAILAGVLIPTFSNVVNNAKDSAALTEARDAYTVYLVENNGEAPDYMLYTSDDRWVVIYKGEVKEIYKSKEEVLTAYSLEDKFVDSGDGKLYIYKESINNSDDNTEIVFPKNFEGLKVSILGDSISTFSGSGTMNNVYPDNTIKNESDTWWSQVIDELGMELLVNNSSGGSRILSDEYFNGNGIRTGNEAAYRDRCVNLHSGSDTPDVILLFMGTNDFSYHVNNNCAKCAELLTCEECTSRIDKNVNICSTCRTNSGFNQSYCNQPLGTADSVNLSNETPTTTCEAYSLVLRKMKEAYPNAYIYCLSLLPRVNPYNGGNHDHGQPTEFNSELRKVAETNGAIFINIENCVSNDKTTWSTYFKDAVHPTASGMDMISQAVIDGMMNKDVSHAVIQKLNNVTSNKDTSIVMDNESVNLTLTPDTNYEISSVTVKMNDEDITAQCYSNGKISIPYVTGNVVISATASLVEVEMPQGIWSKGAINTSNGNISDDPNLIDVRIRTDFIDISNGVTVVRLVGDIEFCPTYYDENFNFISSPGKYQIDELVLSANTYKYMKIMARKIGSSSINPEYGNNLTILNVTNPEDTVWTVIPINSVDGLNSNNGWTTRISTNLINITNGLTISLNDQDTEYYVFYFDRDYNLINNSDWMSQTLNIPAGEKLYIRLVARCKSNTNKTITEEYGENISLNIDMTNVSWNIGTINVQPTSGENSDAANRIRTGFIKLLENMKVEANSSSNINIVFYDKDFKILQENNNCGWCSEWSGSQAPTGTVFIRIVAKAIPEASLETSFGGNITIKYNN